VKKLLEFLFLPFLYRPPFDFVQIHIPRFSDQDGLHQARSILPMIKRRQPILDSIGCRKDLQHPCCQGYLFNDSHRLHAHSQWTWRKFNEELRIGMLEISSLFNIANLEPWAVCIFFRWIELTFTRSIIRDVSILTEESCRRSAR